MKMSGKYGHLNIYEVKYLIDTKKYTCNLYLNYTKL